MGERMRLPGATLALLIGLGSLAAQGGEPGTEKCLDAEVCPMPYVRLAKQETEPFLFLGKLVEESHPRYEDYKDSIRRFPDVRACLVESEREKPVPDLRLIDWDAFETSANIDVCVFRIASSIGDVDTMKEWLRHHGFHVSRDIPLLGSKNESDSKFIVDSFLPVDRFREIFPRSWLWKLIGVELVHGYSLSIDYSESGQVVGVTSIATVK